MNLGDVIKAIKGRWEEVFPGDPFYLQLAQGNINAVKPPYTVFRLGPVTQNQPTSEECDWVMTGTFYVFNLTDLAIIEDVDLIVDAFNRQTAITGPGGTEIYSSLVQSTSVDVNYTDQGSLWSAAISVEFRWTSLPKELVSHAEDDDLQHDGVVRGS